MHPDTHLAIQLQALDHRAALLEKEVATLPKQISLIEKALEGHQRKLDADKAALSANQKERKRIEGDIQMNGQKISKLRDQMLGAKNNEQYKAFQHEIDYLETETRKFEDRTIQLMSESEALDANVKTADLALKEEKKGVDAEKVKAQERTALDQEQLNQIRAERQILAQQLTQPTLAAYERIAKRRNGIVVVEAAGGRCSACRITLRPQYSQDLRRGDKVMFCESCGRILYYNPPVNVEDGTRVAM